MAVRIKSDTVTVTHSEYCWVWFNKIMDFSPFITCGSFCLTNTVVSFWLCWLPIQSRWPLKCIPWHFHLVSVCLHAGFISILLVAQYRYHSAAQPQLPLDIFILLLTFAFPSASPSWKMHSVSPNDGVWKSGQGSLQGPAKLEADPENLLSYQFISDENNPALP